MAAIDGKGFIGIGKDVDTVGGSRSVVALPLFVTKETLFLRVAAMARLSLVEYGSETIAELTASIPLELFRGVRFVQEQDANNEANKYYSRADEVGKQDWIRLPDSARLKNAREISVEVGESESTAHHWSNDGAVTN